jgi:aspartyl-tRNA(Asn)/glutamyl-tRNA(Gln) amidotransferase subunit A
VPGKNATAFQRLHDAGAVLLGKLATHEFASGGPSLDLPWPPARNPWNTAHFTGGSSTGAAAAVAAGFALCALGTDTGGSIRIPAAMCGLAGLKPTYGRVSRYGVIPNSFTFDHCGPLAWTVEDCAIVLQAIAGHDPRDPSSSRRAVPEYRSALTGDIRGLRIGLLRHFWETEAPVAPEARAAVESAIEVFRGLGAHIGLARMRTRQEYNNVRSTISRTELLSVHDRELRERPGDFGEDFIGRNLAACLFTASDVVRAQRERRRMIDELETLCRQFDVFLMPGATPAPRLDMLLGGGFADKWENPNIYAPFNLTGAPALVLCNGYTDGGLPLAMQIAGRPFDEATVLRAGHAYEQATAWRARRPVLTPGHTKPPLQIPPPSPPAHDIDPAIRGQLEAALARAGYRLTDRQLQLVCRVAPHVLAAAQRIPRDQARGDEPAAIFRFADE